MGEEDGFISFLREPLSPAFGLRVIALPAGARRDVDEADWWGTLVVVEDGEIELELASERRCRLRRGAVMWLTGLELHALCNPGPKPAVLVAVWRRHPSTC